MSRSHPSVHGVERLLRQAGVVPDSPHPARGGGRRPPRTAADRILRRLRRALLLPLACAALAIAALLHWGTGTAGEPLVPPSAPGAIARPAAADPRFGIVEAFAAPAAERVVPIGWERVTFWWRELQPSGPESWNAFATGHDGFIDREVAAGRHLAGVLINTPGWAAAAPGAGGASPPVGLYRAYDDPRNAWGRFVGRMARRYAGRVDDWIVWNEVGIPAGRWHTWAGTRGDYARLVEVASLAAKAANPRARIVLAGDPYWYDRGAWFADLLGRLAAAPGARAHGAYFDVANLHLYSRPTDAVRIVGYYRSVLRRYHLDKPIWIAETNAIPYNDSARRYPSGGFRATLDDQASYIVQALAIDAALGVRRIEVNRMLDGADFAAGGEPFGLLRNDGTARPALAAYRTASTLFAAVTGGSVDLSRPDGAALIRLRRPGQRITVLWSMRTAAISLSLPAHRASARLYDVFGQGRIILAQAGLFTLHLRRATGTTNSADASDVVIGGSPLILIEPL